MRSIYNNLEVNGIMTRKEIFLRSALFIMALGLFINPAVPDRAFSYSFPYWEKGPAGLELALMYAEEGEKPLIVYFHIDSSAWNERMNDEYLANYEVEEFLQDIPKAEINPDEGEAEAAIAAKYGADQYPAFLVYIPSFNTEPRRIHPFSKSEMTTADFLKVIKENIVYEYNKRAFECFENKDYENAVKYYEMSLQYDPDSVYTYYAMGSVYNFLAAEQNDRALLKKAEENYSKALEIDPEHELSIEALEKLRAGPSNR